MILVQPGPGWSHVGLASGSAALDWFMKVLSAMAGMIRPLHTLVSYLPASCSHGGGLRVPKAARGDPSAQVLPMSAFFSLAAIPLARASHMLKPRACAGGDHPMVWSQGDMYKLGPFLKQSYHRAVRACVHRCLLLLLLLMK